MLLPTPSILLKTISSGVIAPHGITDLVHAIQNNKINEINKIYVATTGSVVLLDIFDQHFLIEFLFFVFSIIHFQHDVPLNNKTMRYFITSSMLLTCILYDPNLLYFYLTFIHVPQHYKTNWNMLHKTKELSIFIISTTTFASLLFINELSFENTFSIDLIKGIIISHIIYQEKYILTT
tara:strand:- start:217 stop:753 length:537 start_codon:yes stop_codon:yes gene_type:complete